MKVFVFDSARCNGCRNCQIVCKDEHCGNDWPGYARSQPVSGQFWIRVTERVRGTVPKVVVSYALHMCRHCGKAPCAEVCPVSAFKRRDDGLLVLDPVLCNGCMLCIDACPYGALFENEELSIAQKCSGCAHLLDDGWEEPRCVDACPHGSLGFMEEHEAQQRYGRDFEEALQNHGERLIILNKPKTFVAGTTVDLVADEVVIGARITLENKEDGALLTQTSDEFGDFWFKQVDPCDYRIYIERDGYLNQSRELSTKEADCNVGIIEMASASFFEGISEELHIEEDEIMDAPRDEINLDLSSGNDYYKFKKGT